MRNLFIIAFVSIFSSSIFAQQPQKPTSSEIYHNLQELNFLGTALYLAAHPDDENTKLISYLVNDVHARTAYLSMTRGDGGQNLVGPELRETLGVIRTQELLAARRTDGAQQFFTRANDFGYSKTPDETLKIWNKEEVLSDVVRAIRRFKPDVIINRFDHRSPGTTHGHHTSSAMLSVEAFDLVGDASKFPNSSKEFGTWQPKRLFFNTSWWFYGSKEKFDAADKSNLIDVETGGYFPSMGLSNGEIASLSRSNHKSQGFGSTGSRGNETEYLEFLKGDFPKNKNIFDGINTTWSRIEGGAAIGKILEGLEKNFNFKDPSQNVPALLQAYSLLINVKDDNWREIKLPQLKQLILDCSGIFLEAASEKNSINPKEEYSVNIEAINRGNEAVTFSNITDEDGNVISAVTKNLGKYDDVQLKATISSKMHNPLYSSPYWLNEVGTVGMYKAPESLINIAETPAPEKVVFNLKFGAITIPFTKPVVYKFNDPVKGEVYRRLEVLPEVTSSITDKVIIFPDSAPKQIPVIVRAGRANISGNLSLQVPIGWQVKPEQQVYNLTREGETQTFMFTVTPSKDQSEGLIKPLLQLGDAFFDKELVVLDYEHIPYQSILYPSEAKVVRLDVKKKGQLIGYINGAGDAIPESLKQVGYTVITVTPNEINEENLKRFDAVVIGIRAYNTVEELVFKQAALNKYVENGGTLVVQYNTNRGLASEDLAPYKLELSRDRVVDEDSEVEILAPNNEILNSPNKITQADFKNWVQERGLYFPNKWADEFTPILGMHDVDEAQTKGSLLVAKYGKGYYIYTGLSFFRELPAGVAGAYRLFTNLLSIGK